MRLTLAVIFINIISNGCTNQHRFTVLFGEDSNQTQSDVEIGRNLETYSYSSKDIILKGSIRKSMLFLVGRTDLRINMLCSPIAAVLALEKLGFGASEDAKDEIERAVGERFDADVERDARRVVRMLRNLPGVILNFGSRIYVSHTVRLKNSYTDKVEKAFGNSVIRINFTNKSAAASIINSWVSGMTDKLIKKIVEPDDLPRSEAMIIVNAMYFKGKWKHPFEPKHTTKQYFFITREKAITVSMMKKESTFRYINSDDLKAQLILLPFHGDEASMLIILPKTNSRDKLKSLFNKLLDSPRKLASASCIDNMKKTRVQLSMPKFKIGITMELDRVLKLLGVRRIFKDGGLTRIADDIKHLVVDKAIQKIYVAVDEFGAEGAQATAIGIEKLALQRSEMMTVDHPFVFMVLAGGEQLFSGVYAGTEEP